MPKQLLIVEPDANVAGRLVEAAAPFAYSVTAPDFETARVLLEKRSFDWLVTNLRLGEYNGLHLIHLVTSTLLITRTLVYDDLADPWLADEAQRIGAFYERGDRVADAISGYLRDPLPASDRRSPLATVALACWTRRSVDEGNRKTAATGLSPSGDAIVVTYRVERWPAGDALEPSADPIPGRRARR